MDKIATSVKLLKMELSKVRDNALVIGFLKDKLSLDADLKELGGELGNIIAEYIKGGNFRAEKGEIKSIFINRSIKNIILVGLGDEKKYNLDVLLTAIADASKRLRDNGTETFSIYLDSFKNNLKEEEAAKQIALSSLISLYKFTQFKTKDRDKVKYVREITIIANSGKNFGKEIEYASVVADAVKKTRDIVNTPPNIATPKFMADYAKEIASKLKLKCTIFSEDRIKKMNMGCFMAVARGSAKRPKLAVIEYWGAGSKQRPIAIVGKGITFDSGGLNVKPYPSMCNMKDDKAGAVSAIHVIEASAKLKLPINLAVITPFCENMIDADSYRPDDILGAYSGMTVEIKNTDAEGRLILADALSYAAKNYKPEAIIDIATLTGASLIVLGYVGTPYVCTGDKLRKKISEASAKSLEKVWELPLWNEYEDSLKSDFADVKHIGDEGEAGVITASMFLKNFVDETPWLHIDIGTTAWSKVDKGMLTKGATGATVRLLMEMLSDWK